MFDLVELIKTAGYLGLFAIIFAESGLFFGFFLPGDSLLFTAGFLASQDFLSIYILIPLLFAGAVLGDSVGYAFGRRVGERLFIRKDSFFFNKEHVARAHALFQKHGKKTIIIARFLPIVRTFVPILAGVGTMHYRTFLAFNVIGGLLWTAGLLLLGYFLGNVIPNVDRYLLPIVGGIIVISVLPTVIELLRDPHVRQRLVRVFKK